MPDNSPPFRRISEAQRYTDSLPGGKTIATNQKKRERDYKIVENVLNQLQKDPRDDIMRVELMYGDG